MAPRTLVVSVTDAGAALAERLPYEHVRAQGSVGEVVAPRWPTLERLVVVGATGIAVRVVAPLLGAKGTGPGVVCLDDAGRWAIALVGGHAGGANDLAGELAATLGATAVVTTATDAAGLPALERIEGWMTVGALAAVTAALLRGDRVALSVDAGLAAWTLPPTLAQRLDPAGPGATSGPRLRVTDRSVEPGAGEVVAHPPSLVLGVGSSAGVAAREVAALVDDALAGAGLARASVAEVATVDLKAREPGIVALGHPMRTFAVDTLAAVAVPTPSEVVAAAVGTPSVAEAAALVAAGPGATLVVPKVRSAAATVAVARRAGPRGHLAVVGLGPGGPAHRTPAAAAAVRHASVVVGYGPYLDQAADLLGPAQDVVASPIGAEVARATTALERAADGARVALVCSGDAGVYAMASIVFELAAKRPDWDPAGIEVLPGVTAALASAALLGAPLGHDHVAISLSDLLTPWPVIEGRIRAAAAADLVVTFYNPRSKGRDWQLGIARSILVEHRGPATPVGLVTDAGRPGQRVQVTSLGELDVDAVGMTTCVVVGSSASFTAAGRIVTPRGYEL